MTQEQAALYRQLLERELVPALGCTEPSAIAFAAGSAAQVLGKRPEGLLLSCSASVIKNVHSVAIPNAAGLRGIPAAATIGALIGDGSDKLCILQQATPEILAEAKKLCREGYCTCTLAQGVGDLYIHVRAWAAEETAEITVAGGHTNIVLAKKNDRVLSHRDLHRQKPIPSSILNVREILEYAQECALAPLQPILDRQIESNLSIAQEGLSGSYGVNIGRRLLEFYGNEDVRLRARAYAAAGSDARMNGCVMPVVINSGSGNQGLTVSVPVIVYAQELHATQEDLYRALVLANLISIGQKRSVGNLSAFCGAVHAAAGAACGVAYLMGGQYEDLSNIITYTLGTIGGMLCDGAKSSCAGKIAQALDTAFMGLELSMQKHDCYRPGDGLVKENVEKTIDSFGRTAREGMQKTNEVVLKIMLDS